jgi:deoxyadenosine/deoxycytidine kinase
VLIVIGGMIGLGKTTVAELLANEFDSQVFYESVDDNPILPLFYTSTTEEIERYRYPFLLQLHFLHTRFEAIKKALISPTNVLDRSIYEDWYFAKINKDIGRINEMEFEIYEKLLYNMLEDLEGLPKKSPDLMVYLKASFETVMYRIGMRGREFEQDTALIDYYRTLWQGYDEWVRNHYKASDVVVIDMDKIDIVKRQADRQIVVEAVRNKLKENGVL